MTDHILRSTYTDLGEISLPEWTGRRLYMHTFDPARPVMASGFEDYLETVAALCAAANVQTDEAHMTVDEIIVPAGESQRRGGVHVEGRYIPTMRCWGGWSHHALRMSAIVAASAPGCIVYKGEFVGTPKKDGDLEHIRDQLGGGYILPANRAFLMGPDCIHESIAVDESEPTKRTFFRVVF